MSEQQYDWSALLQAAGITPPSNPVSLRQALAAIAAHGGTSAQNSWITASGVSDLTLTTSSQNTNFAWAVDGTNGTPGWDLSEDGLHFECLASGLYAVYIESVLTVPTAAIDEVYEAIFDDFTVTEPYLGINIFLFQDTYVYSPGGAISQLVIPWSLVPMYYIEGDPIGLFAGVKTVTSNGPLVLTAGSTFSISRLI